MEAKEKVEEKPRVPKPEFEAEAKRLTTKSAEVGHSPKVAELIVRPLADGHIMNIVVKVPQEDGTTVDETLTTNSTSNPLRIELSHLQEVVVRVKVKSVAVLDYDQSAVVGIAVPLEDEAVPTTRTSKTHDATHTARK